MISSPAPATGEERKEIDMTINDCIKLVDTMMPNETDRSVKLRLLGEIEGRVKVELLGTEPGDVPTFDEDTPEDTALCVPPPFDQIYLLYVMSMMDYLNGDVTRYENGAVLFNQAYQGYGKWLKRRGG